MLKKIKSVVRLFPFLTKIYDARQLSKYRNNPVPWTYGYNLAKWKIVESIISSGEFPGKAFGAGFDERVVEHPWVVRGLAGKGLKMLDAGSALNHSNILNRLSGNKLFITTLYPETYCQYKDGVSYTYEDIRELSFKSGFFNTITCISTIEHVGFDNSQYKTVQKNNNTIKGDYIKAVLELKRVLQDGGEIFITVPYGKHMVFSFFQTFDYNMVTDLIKAFQPTSHSLEVFAYSKNGWAKAEPKQCDDLEYCLPENIPAPDNAVAARGVALIKLVK